MARPSSDRTATLLAAIASAVMIAFQLAGKATRDALFLSTFEVATLPRMVIAAALVSALTVLLLSRLLAREGPTRVVPGLFLLSALLLLVESVLATRFRSLAAVLYYLHFSALGALLISGFWAVVTERFDPRTARQAIGRITAGASVGGLLGGLLTAPLGSLLPLTGILPILALLHLVAGGLVLGITPRSPAFMEGSTSDPAPGPMQAFRASGHLRLLALLVVLTAMAEGLLDWAFKARVLAVAPSGEELLRFFALFYTATTLLGIMLQSLALRTALERFGFARSAAFLPAGTALGALGGLLLPGLPPLVVGRGTEVVLRHSIFRSAYELLFTPVPPAEKRATKLLVDVGATRLGDLAGGVLTQAFLVIAAGAAGGLALAATIVVALATLVVARLLHRGHAEALARSLTARADRLPGASDEASALLQTVGGFDLGEFRTRRADAPAPAPLPELITVPAGRGEALDSRDARIVEAALAAGPLPRALAERAVSLLAWDTVAPEAIRALSVVAPDISAMLISRLLDPDEDFAIRRRLVRVLAGHPTAEIFEALHRALADRRFEVRYLAGRALFRQSASRPDLVVDRAWICAAVVNEVNVGRGVWESRRLIDAADDEAAPMETALLRDRADRSLEHVFTLLALFLPRVPLRLAYHGLHTADRHLRGTALEYLESVLPADVRERLWPFLEPEGRKADAAERPPEEALGRLLESRESIVLALAAVRERRNQG